MPSKRDSFGKLHEADGHELTKMLSLFNGRTRSGQKRIEMTLFCFSRLYDSSDPSYFECGRGTIARHCDVTDRTAQMFLEAMESDGWFVRVGETKNGKGVRRTFAWLANDVENSAGEVRGNVAQAAASTEKRSGAEPENVQGVNENHTDYVRVPERKDPHLRSPSEYRVQRDGGTDTAVSEETAGLPAEDQDNTTAEWPKAYRYDGYDKGPEELLRGWDPFG